MAEAVHTRCDGGEQQYGTEPSAAQQSLSTCVSMLMSLHGELKTLAQTRRDEHGSLVEEVGTLKQLMLEVRERQNQADEGAIARMAARTACTSSSPRALAST